MACSRECLCDVLILWLSARTTSGPWGYLQAKMTAMVAQAGAFGARVHGGVAQNSSTAAAGNAVSKAVNEKQGRTFQREVKDVVQLFANPAASLAVKSALLKTNIHHSRFWVEQKTADPEAASPVRETLSVSANPPCSPGFECCNLAELIRRVGEMIP
jgi:hypothetical protein